MVPFLVKRGQSHERVDSQSGNTLPKPNPSAALGLLG
jgi:hypothetical protein